MANEIASRFVEVDGIRLHYRECGTGEPVLLLHGWPTSSYLWRNILPILGERVRAIALDLPGFGKSDKPPEASYSFRFHTKVLSGFLDAIGVSSLGLAVHDLGGPVGLYWATQNEARVTKLALLNTIIYPELSWAVMAFVAACRVPGMRSLMTSRWGLRQAMRIGVHDPACLDEDTLRAYTEPFVSTDARRALARAGFGLHPAGMKDVARYVEGVRVPLRIVYGTGDRILPDVGETMARVVRAVPQAELTKLERCGHFLQEERPREIAEILREFFAQRTPHATAT